MDAGLLRSILGAAEGVRAEGNGFVAEEGHELALHAARDGFEISIERIRSIRLESAYVVATSATERKTVTYVETSSIAALVVREDVRSDKKRPGFL